MSVFLVALLAVAAPVHKLSLYEQCSIFKTTQSYCAVLVASHTGETYCCQSKVWFKKAIVVGQQCDALDRFHLDCDVIYSDAQITWCCQSDPDSDDLIMYSDDNQYDFL